MNHTGVPGTGNDRISQFTLPRLERVVSGAGAVQSLPAELDRYGCTRVVIVTGKTLSVSNTVARLTAMLGGRCVAVFSDARQHVPSGCVDLLVSAIRQHRADGLVSVGGGSPIDAAKAAIHALLGEPPAPPEPSEPSEPSALVHIAIPTTLSAGEFTYVAGITDEATRIKRAVYDVRLAPRTVIADPELTIETPGWLWAASGIRALDHAIETLYAREVHPISEPLAVRAIDLLTRHLPKSLELPTTNSRPPNSHGAFGNRELEIGSVVDHRAQCQMAAWLAVFGITNAGFGLSHLLGHQIGPRWNVPHGVTSAIMLPHVMRFMADAVPKRFARIAEGFGLPFDAGNPRRSAHACAEQAAEFIARFDLPQRLRGVDVPKGELNDIADHVCDVLRDSSLVDRPIGARDLLRVLNAAY